MHTGVFVFAERSDAGAALTSLKEQGFAPENLHLLTRFGVEHGTDFRTETGTSKLSPLPSFEELSAKDAAAYRNALQAGHVLLTVTGSDLEMGDAAFLVGMHDPIEVWSHTDAQKVERGRVRVDTMVTTHEEQQEVTLRDEVVHVERHITDRPVPLTDALFAPHTFEWTEYSEEAIVSTTAHIIEEVVLSRRFTEKVETLRGTVRRTDVRVEEEPLSSESVSTVPPVDRAALEQAALAKAEAERLAAERVEAERLDAERIAAEKREIERLAAEKAEAERLEAERVEAERAAAQAAQAEQERLAALAKAEADALAAADAAKEKTAQQVPPTPQQNTPPAASWGQPLPEQSPWGNTPHRRGQLRPFEEMANDLRAYHDRSQKNSGYTFEQFLPVYQFGHSVAANEEHRGEDWAHVEIAARRAWEASNPGTWEMFKDGIYYAWAKALV